LAATGTEGEGKTLALVDALPETGDENTYYGLKAQVESDKGPVENPQAGVGFNAILNFNPDLSSGVIGRTGTATAVISVAPEANVELAFSALSASSVFENVTAGENSTVVQMVQVLDSNWLVTMAFIDDNDGTVEANGITYPKGLYVATEEGSTDFQSTKGMIDEEAFETSSAGVYTLDQNAIDAGFCAILMAFNGIFKRGIYGFDGVNFNLQLDLTDFGAAITRIVEDVIDLRSRVETLETWMAGVEGAAGTANGGA
jgi:hypothetical protein